jgi:hypothetical protein
MKSVPELFLHDAPETTARSPRIDQSMQKQRTLDQAATTARSRLNDRSIQAQRTLDSGKRAHVATALKVSH